MGALVTAGYPSGTNPNPADFSNRTQTYFNPKLLQALLWNLRLAKFGLSQGYSAIGDKIRFFRPRKASLANINAATISFNIVPLVTPTSLAEGVAPTNKTEVAVGYVDITMSQRAGLASISDHLQAIDLLNTLKVYSETMGRDAALDYDTVCRNQLINGLFNSNNTYVNSGSEIDGGYFERFANTPNTGNSANDYATLAALAPAASKMTRGESLKMVTQLKVSKIPKIGNRFVAMVSPAVVKDIREDTTWTQTGTFQDKNALFEDAELMLDGVAFVQHDNPWIEGGTYGTESNTAPNPGDSNVYSSIYLGNEAFGLPNLKNKRAGGSQSAPQLIVLNGPDKADPINQITTIGWKSFFGAGAFITQLSNERPRYGILRTKSTMV